MIVVMPAGHTRPAAPGGRSAAGLRRPRSPGDFPDRLVPYVETALPRGRRPEHRDRRAVDGRGPDARTSRSTSSPEYGYVGVFSSGIFGIVGGRGGSASTRGRTRTRRARRRRAQGGPEARVVRLRQGGLPAGVHAVHGRAVQEHGFDEVFQESGGGHTWINWRRTPTRSRRCSSATAHSASTRCTRRREPRAGQPPATSKNAGEPHASACAGKHRGGDGVIQQHRRDQPAQGAVGPVVSRQPAGDAQREQRSAGDAPHHQRGQRVQRCAEQQPGDQRLRDNSSPKPAPASASAIAISSFLATTC